jgi:transposase
MKGNPDGGRLRAKVERNETVVDEYLAGESIANIARKFRISRTRVNQIWSRWMVTGCAGSKEPYRPIERSAILNRGRAWIKKQAKRRQVAPC